MIIIWSPSAAAELDAIRNYVATDSPRYADLIVRRILLAVERLTDFPDSGRIVPDRPDRILREVVVSPYRIVYRVRDETVEIVAVFHARRLFPSPV